LDLVRDRMKNYDLGDSENGSAIVFAGAKFFERDIRLF